MGNRFTRKFSEFACEGDTILAHVDGFDIAATIARDDSSDRPDQRDDGFWPSRNPDDAGYVGWENLHTYEAQLEHANKVMDAWKNDEWFYCGIVLSVSKNDIEIDKHAASLWGIECNYPKSPTAEREPNDYLTTVANELLEDALTAAKKKLASLCADCLPKGAQS